MFSEAAVPYIKASVPVLREHGVKITTVFYNSLFNTHPELRNVFNMRNQADGTQQQSLAAAVFAYAANFENPAALAPVVTRIVHKHASLGIVPEHYPIVGTHLLGAIKEVLGDAATPELIDAWAEAYGALANALITEEKNLYANTVMAGDLTDMRVAEVIEQSPTAKTLKLQPLGNEGVPSYKPGQYVSVYITFADGHRQPRQYSLSDAPGTPYLSITVKKEPASGKADDKSVSNWIHDHVAVGDTLQVSHPYGEFVIDTRSKKPLVMLAAGVGITPMMAALNQLVRTNPNQAAHLLYAVRSEAEYLHRSEIEKAIKNMPNLTFKLYISQPENGAANRLTVSDIPAETLANADIYLCGPASFMAAQKSALLAAGAHEDSIRKEVFGPDLLADLV
ncbi:nitric oxide dioxygenase [Methylophilus rhizosphaerae]|uniref:nitric oxide dioxygenase n=1 Tax=Methylophilus rhizosphaerae TaxID=492660 RepID=A0A1G9CS02_9PROT|nr:globin domain-containing protein [Methylophilus rhizosphaerae]SDK54440.1 nitric oxide dioxygenase [Methylophilus rhizosphaerae]